MLCTFSEVLSWKFFHYSGKTPLLDVLLLLLKNASLVIQLQQSILPPPPLPTSSSLGRSFVRSFFLLFLPEKTAEQNDPEPGVHDAKRRQRNSRQEISRHHGCPVPQEGLGGETRLTIREGVQGREGVGGQKEREMGGGGGRQDFEGSSSNGISSVTSFERTETEVDEY